MTDPQAAPLLPTTNLVSTYQTTPQPSLDGRQVTNYAGNILSGSSAINYGAWIRAHSADYDHWATLLVHAGEHPDAAKRWSYAGLLPYLRSVEHHHDPNADAAVHGLAGPIHCESGRAYPLRTPVLEAFKHAGFAQIPDANCGVPLGVAPWTENWFKGKRQPSGTAYSLEGVTLVNDATVRRIVVESSSTEEGPVARGVEMLDGERIAARREVVLSCGAHRTPQMLMLSGIGEKAQLARAGIAHVVDAPDVGRNFFDHLALHQAWKLTPEAQSLGAAAGHARFNKPEYADGIPVEWFATGTVEESGLRAALGRDGVAPDSHAHVAQPRSHYQIMTAYAPLSMGDGHDVPIDGTHISTGALLYLPTSRGTVTIDSSDPLAHPVIDPGYYATEADRHMLRSALRTAMRAVESPPFKAVVERETPPLGFATLSSTSPDEDVDQRVRAFSTVWHHGAGTAAMGKVVDAELKVKGVKGLRVCDASVFPAPISATPQWVRVMFALSKRCPMLTGACRLCMLLLSRRLTCSLGSLRAWLFEEPNPSFSIIAMIDSHWLFLDVFAISLCDGIGRSRDYASRGYGHLTGTRRGGATPK